MGLLSAMVEITPSLLNSRSVVNLGDTWDYTCNDRENL